jgi:hypothetical protein
MEGERSQRATEMADDLRTRVGDRSDAFSDLLSNATSDQSLEERSARRWQGQIDEESATWEGTLIDLAEGSIQISLDTTRGAHVVGQLTGVGADVLVVSRAGAADIWIRRNTVVSLSALERVQLARGARSASRITLQELLFVASGRRPTVSALLTGQSTAINGVLRSCGADVCVIGTQGDVRRNVIISIAAIEEVTLHG